MTVQAGQIKNFQREVPCNLCGGDAYVVVYKSAFKPEANAAEIFRLFREKGGDVLLDQVVQCTACGLVYIRPRLRDDIVTQEYREASIQGYREQFVSQNSGRELAFTRSMKHINKIFSSPGSLLDVGAANGAFMSIARQQGWDVKGCEPNEWFCRWGLEHYGLSIDKGVLVEQTYEKESFDLITLWDVIEHVPDPRQLFEKCFDLLRPGGMLLCTYPDIGTWIARIMRRRWVFLMSVHLYYFTRRTVTKLLGESGLTVRTCAPHFQTLELGYIVYRMKNHSPVLHYLGRALLAVIRAQSVMLPYWVGINCITAQKRSG